MSVKRTLMLVHTAALHAAIAVRWKVYDGGRVYAQGNACIGAICAVITNTTPPPPPSG
jgi:hypothetical protein